MSNKRVKRFKKRKGFNIGVIIFIIMFIYITINVYIYFNKDHISIYEVIKGSNSENNLFKGLILRDEHLVYSEKAGYISYFQKEGARVSKNAPVFSVNDSTQFLEYITNGDVPLSLSEEDNARFLYEIRAFQKNFSNNNFNSVYNFKEDAYSTVLNLLNKAMIENGQDLKDETGISYTHQLLHSKDSGIISYYMDSFEDVGQDNITLDMFETENYNQVFLRSREMIKQNEPIYKLITSENWSLFLPLNSAQYEKLSGKENVSFTILKDDLKLSAKFSIFTNESPDGLQHYAKLDMDKHLSNYIYERYLDIEVHLESVEGLKIPLSSIIEKEFYLVPLKYFTTGGDGVKRGLLKLPDTSKGEVNITFIPADIYYQDENYAYVDGNLFTHGAIIRLPNSTQNYDLNRTAKLTGVYNINTGYAVFKRINSLYQNNEYCIVEEGTPNGLSVFDHIALDGSTVVEQAIIY